MAQCLKVVRLFSPLPPRKWATKNLPKTFGLCLDKFSKMDAKLFYGARPCTFLALVPENPEDSDADLSDDDDQIEDPDYQPTQEEVTGDTPLFEMLRKQCLLIPSTYKHSVDEVMVAYKGTRAGTLCQYIANKPDKWGFKLFCRASSSGIIHDLLLYQGSSTFFNVALSEQEQVMLLGAKVVTTLCKTIAEPRLSVVFCDNYFTSFSLIQNLHADLGVMCIGTVRSNRIGGATLMTDKELMKKGRGAFDYRSAEGVIAVKWFDNICVNLLSNARGIVPLSTVKRWSEEAHAKIAIPCPSLIPAYNQHMGGIDLSDMLVHLYKVAKSNNEQ